MSDNSTSCALAHDILEWHVPEEVLSVLLKDRSTGKNLIWATDDYAVRGKGFGADAAAIRQMPSIEFQQSPTVEIDSNGICHLSSDEIRPSAMAKFDQNAVVAFPNCHTLCDELSGSHYSTHITVENEDAGRLGGCFTVEILV